MEREATWLRSKTPVLNHGSLRERGADLRVLTSGPLRQELDATQMCRVMTATAAANLKA